MAKSFVQWLAYMESLNPVEIELGLERTVRVHRRLVKQSWPFVIITIAGTNGKGSTAAILEALALQANLKPLIYTSPHFIDYRERLRFNGKMLTEEEHVEAFEHVENARRGEQLTYFEFATLAAFKLAEKLAPDLLVLETGLGGRLDAVNIIDADIAIITTVDYDHQDWLGDDLESIAREKAGIIAKDKIAVIGDATFPQVIIEEIKLLTTNLYIAGTDFSHVDSSWQNNQYGIWHFLQPSFPFANVSVALQAWSLLKQSSELTESFVSKALQRIVLTGRFEKISSKPTVILDVAHNPQAFRTQLQLLQQLDGIGELHLILGMLSDKNIQDCVDIVKPLIDYWYFCDLPTSRDSSAKQLKQTLKHSDIDENRLQCYPSPLDAFLAAINVAAEDDTILVTGSFYTVAPVLEYVKKHE